MKGRGGKLGKVVLFAGAIRRNAAIGNVCDEVELWEGEGMRRGVESDGPVDRMDQVGETWWEVN
jgi:hypothetical protein